MSTDTLSPAASAVLANLREHVDYEDEPGWGAVYLDNARSPDLRRHEWAGQLSVLEAAGLYRPDTLRDHNGVWGYVKLA